MNNKTIFGLVVCVLVILVVIFFYPRSKGAPIENVSVASPQNATYTIEGQKVTLVNGVSSVATAPGSASRITTQYFGNDVSVDLNGDNRLDSVFLLTQSTGGSGTFYYVVAALNTDSGYVGGEGLLLGDRIAPQSTRVEANNTVLVTYADRKPGESFAVAPSVGKSIKLLLDPKTMQFGEVAQNFEGEANPATMKLTMQTWSWISSVSSNGTTILPHNSTNNTGKKFTLTFNTNKNFSITTDCNGGAGEYTVNGVEIIFGKMISTLMYCEESSQEQEYTQMLKEVKSYKFTSKGELIFTLQSGGTMVFK